MFLNKFRVYTGMLPANQICNGIAPGYRHVVGGWAAKDVKKRMTASQLYINRLNERNGFYDKLLESIKTEGIKNPISICAGTCVLIYQKYLWESMLDAEGKPEWKKVLVCDSKGGSRLWAAQQLDIEIPVLISDFSNMFVDSNMRELHNEEEIASIFSNKPEKILIRDNGINIGNIPHIHLDDPTEKC